jgi:hypothetical protein
MYDKDYFNKVNQTLSDIQKFCASIAIAKNTAPGDVLLVVNEQENYLFLALSLSDKYIILPLCNISIMTIEMFTCGVMRLHDATLFYNPAFTNISKFIDSNETS